MSLKNLLLLISNQFKKQQIEKQVTTGLKIQDECQHENDFSKVPAGIHDPNAPLPKPRNFLAANDDTLVEDLKNIGIEIEVKKQNLQLFLSGIF